MTSSAPLSPLSAMLPAVFAALDDDPESAAFGDTSSESSRTPPPGVPTSPPTPPKKTVTRRRGKAAVDPTAKALKRARRSEIERNSRLRRLDELARMRQDLLRLEYEYKRLNDRDDLEELVSDPDRAASVQVVARKSLSDQRRIHRRLTFMIQLLMEEQNELRKLLREQALFEETVRAAWTCELSPAPDTSNLSLRGPIDPTKEWVHPVQCFAFLRETYELIMAFETSHTYETTGASIMGWTDKRRMDPATGHLHYGFRKQFLGQDAEILLNKTWDLMVDPTKMSRLLVDPSVTTKFTTLQKLNDDLLLIRRDHTHPHVHMTFLTVHVLFRLQTPQGFILCFRTIAVPEIQETLEPHEMWFDIHNFTLFNYIYDPLGAVVGCEVVAGGSLNDPSQVTTKHWFFELVISVLRWEATCVAPLFLMDSKP